VELVFSLKIDLEGDVIHRAISDGIDILKDEFKIWSRKGKLDIYRHAFTLLAPKVRNMRIDQPKYLDSRNQFNGMLRHKKLVNHFLDDAQLIWGRYVHVYDRFHKH